MNDRANFLVESRATELDVAKIVAFLYQASAKIKVQNAFSIVSKQAVPAAFQKFAKRVLGDGYILVSAVKVDARISSELLAVPWSTQGALKLWDDATVDRLRELTERRQFGEKLLLRCAPVACDLADRLSRGLSAEAFFGALPGNEDEVFVVRCLLDVFTARTSFAAGVTEPVPFCLNVSPPATVSSSTEEHATGWVVRAVSTCGVVKLATGPKGRKYTFNCPDRQLLRPLFEAWYSGSTVAVSFAREHPVGLKRPTHHGVLSSVEIVGERLLECNEQGRTQPSVRPPSPFARHS